MAVGSHLILKDIVRLAYIHALAFVMFFTEALSRVSLQPESLNFEVAVRFRGINPRFILSVRMDSGTQACFK